MPEKSSCLVQDGGSRHVRIPSSKVKLSSSEQARHPAPIFLQRTKETVQQHFQGFVSIARVLSGLPGLGTMNFPGFTPKAPLDEVINPQIDAIGGPRGLFIGSTNCIKQLEPIGLCQNIKAL
jgi:hypothetical protein